MTLRELTVRAVALRQAYAQAAIAAGKAPWSAEQLMDGFLVDVGELMRLTMAKEGIREEDDLDGRLAHELADCLWSVLVLAEAHGVDMEKAFFATMAELETELGVPVEADPALPADLSHCAQRALSVRRRYAAYERALCGREWTSAHLMEGFIVDIGDLMRLSMAKAGVRRAEKLEAAFAHELSDCLWCVLVLSDRYAVNLEMSFLKTMDFLASKIAAQAGA